MKRLMICLILLTLCLPAALADTLPEYRMVCNPDPADRLNLRAAPSREAESLGKYFNGVLVEVVVDDGSDWLLVRIGGTEGYMMRRYLTTAATAQVAPMTVTSTLSNPCAPVQVLLSAPDGSAIPLAQIMNGAQITILGMTDTMAHVQIGGITGYMPQSVLTSVPADPSAASVSLPSGTPTGASLVLDGKTYTLTSAADLALLGSLISSVEYAGYRMAGCPFSAALMLTYAGGTQLTVELATDSCCVYRHNGYDYRYARSAATAEGSPDNTLLFNLFGATLPH